ncbi:MAG TPA: DUF1643 domain-containing protein [Acidimicrobiales bacterium]|nr:DUF1643 domain-containing protein [Acidimicrobiales bacterium]
MRLLADVVGSATYSPCKTWRYTLRRTPAQPRLVDAPKRVICWVMLNPSTATEHEDDPTVRRTQTFARAWGYDEVIVCNLFALRSTDPAALYTHPDPVGPDNDDAIASVLADAELAIAAWGVHGELNRRADEFLARHASVRWHCLGTTKHGHPRHPLYVRGDTTPLPLS